MKHDAEWGEFTAMLHERLERGEREYGDGSFTRPLGELPAEIMEELADVCGWAFVMWCRMRKMEKAS